MDFPKIPGYTIRRKLGEGGMAAVYLARQESLERDVALKLLTPAMRSPSHPDHHIERFHRERKSVAGLNHRHIVIVHDSGVIEDCYYMVMELLTGGTLEERLEKNGKLSPDEALGIVRTLADALSYAHAKGLVHRDILILCPLVFYPLYRAKRGRAYSIDGKSLKRPLKCLQGISRDRGLQQIFQ